MMRYEETVLYEMLKGFQEDFPNGGIYRWELKLAMKVSCSQAPV